MKYLLLYFTAITIMLSLSNCNTTEKITEKVVYTDYDKSGASLEMEISLLKGKAFNHPTYVIWLEDMSGNYLKTLFITKSYASGVFGYEMIGDSMWSNKSGESIQPAALPYWTHKKGYIKDKQLVPAPESPYVDAFSGATPQNDFLLETSIPKTNKSYRVLLEVNQTWDWNEYWTNNKYPESDSYKHSAQPSIVYSVVVNKESEEFFLNPIGHGDPKGESGKLFTDLSTITSPNNIFSTIRIKLEQ